MKRNNNGDVQRKSNLDKVKATGSVFCKWKKKKQGVTERFGQLKENTEGLKTMDGSNKKKINGEMKEVIKSKIFLFWAT